jgi:hypothetical protein
MTRSVRVVLAVIIILSVGYVLISPDPTDDVDGVLRPQRRHLIKVQELAAASLLQRRILVIFELLLFAFPLSTLHLTTEGLLDHVCVCRR